MKPFTAAEVAQGTALLAGADAAARGRFIDTVRQGFAGDPQAYDTAMAQFVPDNPLLAFVARRVAPGPAAGAGAGAGGEPDAGDTPARQARQRLAAQILDGEQLIHAPPRERGPGRAPFIPPEAELRAAVEPLVRARFPDLDDAARRTVCQAVRAAYVADGARHGDATGALDPRRLDAAAAALLGRRVRVGDTAVFAPPGLDAPTFAARAEAAFMAQAAAQNIPEAFHHLHAFGLERLPDGDGHDDGAGYRVTYPGGLRYLLDAQGQPVVLWVAP